MKLSVVIIAKNAEKQIKNAIQSCLFADEIIIVDSGSTDKTIKIAKEKGAKVFEINTNNFSDIRNYGLEKASGEWILYVDSDEQVTNELAKEIQQILTQTNSIVAYKILRKNFYLGNHEWPYHEKLERLFKKESLKKWYGQLHESPEVFGSIGELSGFLYHFSHRNLESMLNKTIEWSDIEAGLRYKANHPQMTWWRFPRVMSSAFFSSYFVKGGWKIGTAGLIESMFQAFSIFVTYSKLWELQEKAKKKHEI